LISGCLPSSFSRPAMIRHVPHTSVAADIARQDTLNAIQLQQQRLRDLGIGASAQRRSSRGTTAAKADILTLPDVSDLGPDITIMGAAPSVQAQSIPPRQPPASRPRAGSDAIASAAFGRRSQTPGGSDSQTVGRGGAPGNHGPGRRAQPKVGRRASQEFPPPGGPGPIGLEPQAFGIDGPSVASRARSGARPMMPPPGPARAASAGAAFTGYGRESGFAQAPAAVPGPVLKNRSAKAGAASKAVAESKRRELAVKREIARERIAVRYFGRPPKSGSAGAQ